MIIWCKATSMASWLDPAWAFAFFKNYFSKTVLSDHGDRWSLLVDDQLEELLFIW